MDIRVGPVLKETPDIRHAVRRLRWFAASFRNEVARVSEEIGVELRTDDAKVAKAFVAWLRAFKAQRGESDRDPRDFTYFAAGLMLRELVRHEPVLAVNHKAADEAEEAARFWPEGFAYVAFCLGVCSEVLKQEFRSGIDLDPSFWDRRAWWSFRENVREDPSLAIGFFDLFAGIEPNWTSPSSFVERRHTGPERLEGGRTQLSLSNHIGPNERLV
jgi:hypothetical protein